MQIEFKNIEYLVKLTMEKFSLDLTSEMYGFVQIYSVSKHGLLNTIDVYSTHYKIQNEITNSDAVDGYEILLESLKNEMKHEDFELFQINIVSEKLGYIFFTDLNVKELYGVLKMKNQNIDRNTEINKKNELRGTWTNKKFFLNGKEL